MTVDKAIETLEDNKDEINIARRMAASALAKQKAIKPTLSVSNGEKLCKCPTCNQVVGSCSPDGKAIRYNYHYCAYCGQKIDWRGEA